MSSCGKNDRKGIKQKMLEDLKKQVYESNIKLFKSGLVILTWGNASSIDRKLGLVVIKPSGVNYDTMKCEDMVVVDLDGKVIEGKYRPSVDLPTHLELYKAFPSVNGIVHDHSTFATSFAQAEKEIIPYGTTQADTFFGNIPCTLPLNKDEVENEYTKNTGLAIIKRFRNVDYLSCPGTLVANHGVFAWGNSIEEAVNNAITIEECAKMAYITLTINENVKRIPQYLSDVHYNRKHGKNHTYGQEKK
jgi:L-ribulose-5-phosphate 4-epimerase